MTVTKPNAAGNWPCPCCGYHTLPEMPGGTFAYCPVCGWEDDPVQFDDLDYRGGANEPSLREARRNFEMLGRCDNLDYPVRPPSADERPRFDWSMHGGLEALRRLKPRHVSDSPYSIKLGRDAAVRPFQDSPEARRFQCVCCEQFALDSVDHCDICGNCGWQDWHESHDSPAEVIRPNYVSLVVAREVLARFGPAALCAVNRAGGVKINELEAMSSEHLQSLPTLDQKFGRIDSE
jgi:hypothetical protein